MEITDELFDEIVEKIFSKRNEIFEEKDYIKVETVKEKMEITDSKIGGVPYIPRKSSFPKTPNGDSLKFLAQINCKDFKGLENFPEEGILQFFDREEIDFIDWENMESEENFKVIYYEKIEEYFSEDEIKKMHNLNKDETYFSNYGEENGYKIKTKLEKQDKQVFEEEDIAKIFEIIIREEYSKLNLNDKELENLKEDITYAVFDKLSEIFEDKNRTQCGGYPSFVQSDPRIDNQNLKRYDTVLFQLDSEYDEIDDEYRVLIGDVGSIQFLINSDDLKNKDFSKILYEWACS